MCLANECTSTYHSLNFAVTILLVFVYSLLCEDWNVSPDVQQQLEQFTCIMYGEARETSVNAVRAKMLRKMVGENQSLTIKSKVDLSRIPPCKDSLLPHIQRVNYRVACYKKADEPLFWKPKPYDAGQGWQKNRPGNAGTCMDV